ncbi:XRE family transcriptional regulator [Macrococcoides bohemicum]|uniref:helix-turn-helix domain-containing protein n=1 Tax=Macrococcoides bohemicum TaxID=1903056 RepID=UPI001059AC8F|nr:helix-turn-helix transcriptional regulator [Macrococcus bohemicus]TDL37700.1 XRE family transcriptional regulator [Macrococcus bohemicus]
MSFGKRLKQLRLKKGITQEELGALIGVQKAAIYKYENEIVKNPKDETINKLSKIFNVTPSYLRGYDDRISVGRNLYNSSLNNYSLSDESIKVKHKLVEIIDSDMQPVIVDLFNETLQLKENYNLLQLEEICLLLSCINRWTDIDINNLDVTSEVTDLLTGFVEGIKKYKNIED